MAEASLGNWKWKVHCRTSHYIDGLDSSSGPRALRETTLEGPEATLQDLQYLKPPVVYFRNTEVTDKVMLTFPASSGDFGTANPKIINN
jgi:hypothetical protein